MKNPLSSMLTRSFVLKSLLVLSILAVSVFASAQTAGYDLLQTGSGASIDLSSVNLGNVPLNGVPIQGSTGTTDTILHRTQDVPQGGGTVPLEVTALFMKSASSVNFNGQPVDVYVTINNSGGKVSTNSTYTTTPPAGYPSSTTFPSGGIYPRPVHNGPHPVVPSKCSAGIQPASPQSPTTSASNRQPTGSSTAIATCISAQ
jgi:hypothetical protein